MIISWLGCSTESTGLGNVDATNSLQGIDEPPPVPDARTTQPDRPADASLPGIADAAVLDAPGASIDQTVAAVDLAPDRAPLVDQPPGAACGKNGECKSLHCADGVCCDTACDDGCSACTLARTGRADGVCSWAKDLEGKACGKECSSVATMPAVVQKVCVAGACQVPSAPKGLESCRDDNPCVSAFCDNNEARCVKTTCAQGSCCCRSPDGQRACSKQDQCKGQRMCE